MKLTLEEMREVAKRLPVGYYLGMKVPVLVEDGGQAYCDVVKGVIHIGLGLLQVAADHIDAKDAAKWDREKLLRCLLYHEIGHLLLTPKGLFSAVSVYDKDGNRYAPKIAHDIINIFEDERLESILSSFFMGVDFRAFCELVNKGTRKGKTVASKFYGAVRLRDKPSVSEAVDKAIQKLSGYNATESVFDTRHRIGVSYTTELNELLRKVLEDEKQESEKPQGGESKESKPDAGKSEGEQEQDGGDEQSDEQDDESQSDEQDDESQSEGGDKSQSEGDDEGGDEGKGGEDEGGDEAQEADENEGESKNETGAGANCPGKFPKNFLTDLAKRVFVTPNQDTTKALNRFAMRLSKKKGHQSAGCWSALHGRIDTRRDAMDKDRIFRRRSDVGERLNEAVNLVLWVDRSGSFENSEPTLNEILAATSRAVGMSNGKLSVQVVKMGVCAEVAHPTDWQIQALGGNAMGITYLQAWQKTRAKGRRNIDIVVFDGLYKYDEDAGKLVGGHWRGKYIEEVIWNHPDCHIVSDASNRKYFDKLTKKAHKTYMCSGYAEKLKAEVIKILDRIL